MLCSIINNFIESVISMHLVSTTQEKDKNIWIAKNINK